MSRILLTGASGFIGKRLLGALRAGGHIVYPLYRQTSGGLGSIPKDPEAQVGDITVYEDMVNLFRRVKPETIIHLAALTPVRLSWREPLNYQLVNYLGTVNLVEAAIYGLDPGFRFIYASTPEVYGHTSMGGAKEYSKLEPVSPYAASKVASGVYLEMRKASAEYYLTQMRCSNTFGRPKSGYFVENIAEQALAGGVVKLYNPNSIRDYMFVDDHVSAYLFAVENGLEGTYNFAQGSPIRNIDMAAMVMELTCSEGAHEIVVVEPDEDRPVDQQRIVQDCSLAYSLGWKPMYTRVEGINQLLKMYGPGGRNE